MSPHVTRRLLSRSSVRAAVLLACMAASAPVSAVELVYRASASGRQILNGVPQFPEQQNSGTSGAAASVLSHSAAGSLGDLTASSSAVASKPGTISSAGGFVTMSATWEGASLDPREAGLLAMLTYSLSGSTTATAAGAGSGFGTARAFINTADANLQGSGSASFCAVDPRGECVGLTAMPSLSGTLAVNAGAALVMGLEVGSLAGLGAVSSGVPGNPYTASASGQAQLTFGIELIEDRRHWKPNAAAAWGLADSWIEKAEPDAGSWATFNSTSARTLALTLPGDREWRGLIVDGETLALNLAGQTLTLGNSGNSQKTFSIRVGEGRSKVSSLTLSNGTLLASNDVLVGGVFGSAGPTGSLTVDTGAVLDQTTFAGLGSVIVGDKGPGTLVVRGGGLIKTNVLALARNAPGAGDAGPLRSTLEITGEGSRVEAVLVSLADRGEATATVKAGGVLKTQSLDMAQNRDARATLTVEGAGSKLVMTGAFADVGTVAGGRATLDVLNGGLIEGNNSVFRVGSGKPEDFSVLRIKGPGSLMNDTGVIVQTGGLLEVRDGARWAGTSSLLEVKGGTATFSNATAQLSDGVVVGVFKPGPDGKPSLVSPGQVNIENGSVIDATGANLLVGGGGRLTLTGSGSRLFGFSELRVNGTLVVNSGSTLEGDTLGLKSNSSLQGAGTVIVNERFTAEGQIKPGNSPGLLRIEGDVLLTDTSELVLELAGTAAGTQHDVLEVQGDLTLQGGRVTLSFIDGFAPLEGQQFMLLDVSDAFQSSATFAVTGLQDGWLFSTGFDPGTGQLTLTSLNNGITAVPEPETWLLWGAGLGLWLLRRRRA